MHGPVLNSKYNNQSTTKPTRHQQCQLGVARGRRYRPVGWRRHKITTPRPEHHGRAVGA
uniref:Uncharacterized protein n=1 Tax=Acartia pacifica TaxID=335913 RepID=A0A0U2TGT4_ACAPC|nr:hypothetical protein [Acartia pacifica]